MPTPPRTETRAQPGFHRSLKAPPATVLAAVPGRSGSAGNASVASNSDDAGAGKLGDGEGGDVADLGVGADAGGANRAGAVAVTRLTTIGGAAGVVAAAASSRPWHPGPHEIGRAVSTIRCTAWVG